MKKFAVNTKVNFSRSGSKHDGKTGVISQLRDKPSSPYGVMFNGRDSIVWCDGKFLSPVVNRSEETAVKGLKLNTLVKNVGRGPVGGKSGIITKFRSITEAPEGKNTVVGVKYFGHSNAIVWTNPKNLTVTANLAVGDVVTMNNPKSKRNGQTGTISKFRDTDKDTTVGVIFSGDVVTWCKPSSLSLVGAIVSSNDSLTATAPETTATMTINFNGVNFSIDGDAEVVISGKNISINN